LTSAYQSLPQGSAEGVPLDDKAVWEEEGSAGVLRTCQQKGQREIEDGSREERVPEEEPQAQVRLKLIGGQWHRLCTGPAHDQPVYLPENDKYFYRYANGPRKGKFIARCRLCKAWERVKNPGSEHGWIESDKAKPFFQEAANRIGIMELSKRTGLSQEMISRVVRGRTKFTQKKSLRKVMLELVSIRRKGEHSINGYAAWRVVKRANGYSSTCSGCGTSLGNYTEDCEVCQERERKRKVRLTDS